MDPQNQIPDHIQKALKNAEVFTALEKIGDTYGLLLDQIGSLDVVTRQVLLGKIKSSDYISEIAKELEISNQTAEKIAAEVSTKIFTPLRDSLKKTEEPTPAIPAPTPLPAPLATIPKPPIAPIEKAGDFRVEKAAPSSSPIYNDSSLKKEEVLADLESITNLKPENAKNFVEHLLSAPEKVPDIAPRVVPLNKPPSPPVEDKKYTVDPYREGI